MEETKNKELLKDILNKMDKAAMTIINKLKLTEDSKNPISKNLYSKFDIFINKLHGAVESL